MAEASSSWSNDVFFQQALLHILGRELGIKGVNTEENSSLRVVRHVVFLSSAVHQLMNVFGAKQLTKQEHQALAETVRLFILKPLRQLQAQAEMKNITAMNHWKEWSAEHGFDVQACFVLTVFARVALEVGNISSPSGSSYDGYNSLTLQSRSSEWGFWHGAFPIRPLIRSFPTTGIINPGLRKVFDKRLDEACAKMISLKPDEKAPGSFVLPSILVAIIRYLDTGSYDGLKLDNAQYSFKTGIWIDDPPKYKAQSDWEQDSEVPDCIIL
jgi:hypothetical protein